MEVSEVSLAAEGMDPDERAHYAATVFQRARLDDALLRRGSFLRREMWEGWKAGRREGYRWAWVDRGATKVVALLRGLAAELNQREDDRASTDDLVDVLKVAAGRLRGRYL